MGNFCFSEVCYDSPPCVDFVNTRSFFLIMVTTNHGHHHDSAFPHLCNYIVTNSILDGSPLSVAHVTFSMFCRIKTLLLTFLVFLFLSRALVWVPRLPMSPWQVTTATHLISAISSKQQWWSSTECWWTSRSRESSSKSTCSWSNRSSNS